MKLTWFGEKKPQSQQRRLFTNYIIDLPLKNHVFLVIKATLFQVENISASHFVNLSAMNMQGSFDRGERCTLVIIFP